MAELKKGDTLLVWRLERLGRSMNHLVLLIEDLRNKGIGCKSICDGSIDTATASGELIFNIFSSLAQFERRLAQERTRAGLEAARARGRNGGRKKIDWESLQLTNKNFVSNELQQYHSDVVYKCTIDNKQAYIYNSVEHQSTPDELLPFRLLEYNTLLMRQHLDEKHKKLPIIINLCIYAGQESPYLY